MDGRLSLSAKTLNRRLILTFSAMAAVVMLQTIVGASPARALTTTPDDTYTTNGKAYATALSENRKILYSVRSSTLYST